LLLSIHGTSLSTGNLELQIDELLIHRIHSLSAFVELAAC
jgi:hypothetical protein